MTGGWEEPGGDRLRLLQPRHLGWLIEAEVKLLGGVDGDPVERAASGQHLEQPAPAAAEVLEAEQAKLAAAAEPVGEQGGVGGDGGGAVEQRVAAIADALAVAPDLAGEARQVLRRR